MVANAQARAADREIGALEGLIRHQPEDDRMPSATARKRARSRPWRRILELTKGRTLSTKA